MMNRPAIKVMVIDDSLVFRKYLIDNLPKVQSRIEIVGYAMDPYDAMEKLPKAKPDVITLDIEMPRMNGLDFLKKLLPENPIPVILVSSLNVNVFDALSYGAVDFVKKPDMSEDNAASSFVRSLAGKIMIASQAKVRVPSSIKSAGGAGASAPASASKPAPASAASTTKASAANRGGAAKTTGTVNTGASNTLASSAQARPLSSLMSGTVLKLTSGANLRLNATVIAIGASTGGTEATLEVLKQLPADIPGIVITQHMPKGFTKMYAERLNRLCQMEVKEAEDGDIVKRGRALIAPGGDLQMKVERKGHNYIVRCLPGDKVNGHRPSVDVLFESVADQVRGRAVGIILTGMGQDGAEGLLKMRKAGAYTIGQDKDSCVVYGMPMVAQSLGAVCAQASCFSIPSVLMKHLNSF